MSNDRPPASSNASRRRRLASARAGLIVLAIAAVANAPLPAQSMDEVEIRVTHVAGSVHMLEGRGGNVGVSAGDDGVLIVDDQFAPLAPKIASALGRLGSKTPKFILNTHFHGDHTGGNEVFGKTGTIVAHGNVRARLAAGANVLGRDNPPAPKHALPVVTFDESLTIHMNGETIRAVHLPRAHTDGDALVLFETANVLHMGDTFFSGSFPFVDITNGGSIDGLIDGLRDLLPELRADVRIIPGHGPLSTKTDLETYIDMLEETSAIVRARIDEGMSLEECQAAGLPKKWESWGRAFINETSWLGILWHGLSKKEGAHLGPGAARHRHGHESVR